MQPYILVDYRRIDSGLNATGPYLVTLCGADRLKNWLPLAVKARTTHKVKWIERLMADLDSSRCYASRFA